MTDLQKNFLTFLINAGIAVAALICAWFEPHAWVRAILIFSAAHNGFWAYLFYRPWWRWRL